MIEDHTQAEIEGTSEIKYENQYHLDFGDWIPVGTFRGEIGGWDIVEEEDTFPEGGTWTSRHIDYRIDSGYNEFEVAVEFNEGPSDGTVRMVDGLYHLIDNLVDGVEEDYDAVYDLEDTLDIPVGVEVAFDVYTNRSGTASPRIMMNTICPDGEELDSEVRVRAWGTEEY